jgi:hypothetical protein
MKAFTSLLLLSTAIGCAKADFQKLAENSNGLTSGQQVNYSNVVASANKQVDFLLIVDDSNSMLADQKKLAARLADFVASLENSQIDWQMCMTTTGGVTAPGGNIFGTPISWSDYTPEVGIPSYVLTKGTANLHNVFVDTMNAVGVGNANSGDERGIKAAYNNFKKGNPSSASANGCYRKNAAVSVIVISDEDEASVGGDINRLKAIESHASFKALDADDMPTALLTQSKASFGKNVRFTFNSIVLKSGDSTCEAAQDLESSPSHAGSMYEQMSALTGGGVTSICDADYTTGLNTFKDKIVNSLSQLKLACLPDESTVRVTINGVDVTSFSVTGSTLNFNTSLIEGTKIELRYNCL